MKSDISKLFPEFLVTNDILSASSPVYKVTLLEIFALSNWKVSTPAFPKVTMVPFVILELKLNLSAAPFPCRVSTPELSGDLLIVKTSLSAPPVAVIFLLRLWLKKYSSFPALPLRVRLLEGSPPK